MPEVAFASYANLNGRHDAHLKEFVDALRVEVLQSHPGIADPADCVFFDFASIATGEEWEARIARAVNESKVLVAFCSPHFVASRFCGKEVHLFVERLKAWQRAHPGQAARCVIVVPWKNAAVPKSLARYQFARMPKTPQGQPYELRTLCMLDLHKDLRTQFLLDLAAAIDEAQRQNLTPLPAVPAFDQIPSAFDEPLGQRYGVAVVSLGSGRDREPALELLVGRACEPAPFRLLSLDKTFADEVSDAKANREAVLVVAEAARLADPLFANTVAAVDAAGGDQTGLVVFDTKSVDPRAVAIAFPKSHAAFWEVRIETSGEAGRAAALAEVVAKLRHRLIEADPPTAAANDAIANEARAAGVPVDRKPNIGGPEGTP